MERQRVAAQQQQARRLDAQEAAARQASSEAAEARRIQHAEHNDLVEYVDDYGFNLPFKYANEESRTLCAMFPNLDRDVIDDVVRMKEGR